MWRAQHIGHHVTAWQQAGYKEMPIAVAIGWEPSLGFVGGSPVPKGLCEYDVMGAIRGEPVELVKCETVDLHVPASAEIVIEGYLEFDPDTYTMEGPFRRVHRLRGGRPLARSRPSTSPAITHRTDPILRGTIEGSMPGSFSENGVCSSIMRAATAWNVLDRAGVPGVTDVWCPPVQTGINVLVQIKQSYRGQAKQVANALWGSRRRTCAISTSPWSTTISTFTITPRSTGRSLTGSMPARTTSSSCRRPSAPASIRRRGGATATSRSSAPANGIAC